MFTTTFWLQFFAIIITVMGVAMVLRPKLAGEMLRGCKDQLSLRLTFAFMNIFLGAVIILTHWLWTDILAIVVTVLGLNALLKGFVIMTWPNHFAETVLSIEKKTGAWISWVPIMMGLIFIYLGFYA